MFLLLVNCVNITFTTVEIRLAAASVVHKAFTINLKLTGKLITVI